MKNTVTKTGGMHATGFRKPDGVIMETSEYDKKLLAKGYTIEQTPNGKIYTPPSNER